MASSAGLNRFGVPLLPAINVGTAANATPFASYGTLTSTDPNGSGVANDTGVFGVEADGFTKWGFQLLGSLTNVSVSILCTFDPIAYCIYHSRGGMGGYTTATHVGQCNYYGGALVVLPGQSLSLPATSWVLMEGSSAQSGAGTSANPLTPNTKLFIGGHAVLAIRAVITVAAGAGTGSVVAFAVP